MLKLSNLYYYLYILLHIEMFWLGGASNFNFLHLETVEYFLESVTFDVHNSFIIKQHI